MRIAVITDIHANLPALQAVLAAAEGIGVDDLYCGGDLVGYGPHPNEVCALVEDRGIPTIHGNYDYAMGPRRVRLVHGSPRKVNEYLFEEKPASLYERLAAQAEAEVLAFGHTHKPWVREYGGVVFVNCGSVGKPKDGDPRAAFAVLELVGDRIEVSIERVPCLVFAGTAIYQFLRDARDTIPAAAPAALIEHEEALP